MNPTEKIFEDSLKYPKPLTDQRILDALKRLLSRRAQGKARFPTAIVAGRRLVVIYDHPERLKETLFIKSSGKIRRRLLTLKRKKNPAQA